MLEEKMFALKRACDLALQRLNARGCVGVVVVVPSGAFSTEVSDTGAISLEPLRYIAATSPVSLRFDSASLCHPNQALSAAVEYQLQAFLAKEIGATDLLKHNVCSVLGCAFSLAGSGFHSIAYFLFSTNEVPQSIQRDVSFETYGIWAGLRSSMAEDHLDIARDKVALNVLRLTQMGLTSLEVCHKLGLKNARTVENKIDKMQKLLGAKSKLHTVQKAQIAFLI